MSVWAKPPEVSGLVSSGRVKYTLKFQPLRKKLSTGFVLGSLFIAAGCSASSDNANEDLSQKEAFQSQLIKGELFPTRFEMEPVLRANEEPGSL